jgi:hypothetical protein
MRFFYENMSNPQSPSLGQSTVSFSQDRVQSLISHTTLVSPGEGRREAGQLSEPPPPLSPPQKSPGVLCA